MFSRRNETDTLEFEKDYLGRQVKQLAEAVARTLFGAGADSARDVDAARDKVRRACGEILGIDHMVLDLLDVPSAAIMLRDPHRIGAYAEILEAEAELHRRAGDARMADAQRQRAEALRVRAEAKDPERAASK